MRKASRVLSRVYDEALQDSDLNVTQLAVLRAVERLPGEPLSRVAEELAMDRTALYRAVRTMESHGWLEVLAGRDARSRAARITEKGAVTLEAADPQWDRIQLEVVERFGRRRWQELVREIQALGEVAAQASRATFDTKGDSR